jgi:hypothetical protein
MSGLALGILEGLDVRGAHVELGDAVQHDVITEHAVEDLEGEAAVVGRERGGGVARPEVVAANDLGGEARGAEAVVLEELRVEPRALLERLGRVAGAHLAMGPAPT